MLSWEGTPLGGCVADAGADAVACSRPPAGSPMPLLLRESGRLS